MSSNGGSASPSPSAGAGRAAFPPLFPPASSVTPAGAATGADGVAVATGSLSEALDGPTLAWAFCVCAGGGVGRVWATRISVLAPSPGFLGSSWSSTNSSSSESSATLPDSSSAEKKSSSSETSSTVVRYDALPPFAGGASNFGLGTFDDWGIETLGWVGTAFLCGTTGREECAAGTSSSSLNPSILAPSKSSPSSDGSEALSIFSNGGGKPLLPSESSSLSIPDKPGTMSSSSGTKGFVT